jgi:hypothetical protein
MTVMTTSEVTQWLTTGGDAALLSSMEIITNHGDARVAGDWAASFMQEVPARSRKDYRGSLTQKQRDTTLGILSKPTIMSQLQTLLPVYFEGSMASGVPNQPLTSAAAIAAAGKAPSGKKRIDPDYEADDLWGSF